MRKRRLIPSLVLSLVFWIVPVLNQAQSSPGELTFPGAEEQVPFLSIKEIYRVEPQYTEEARKSQLEGTVSLYVEVAPHGIAENIRVLRSLGLGLDEKAVEAVRQWRFEPATMGSELITAAAIVLVNFHLPVEARIPIWFGTQPKSGGEIYRVSPSGSIAAPRIISRVEPTYTQEARDAHRQGVVVLYAEITPEGRPENIQILRGLGMGMDEKAVETYRQWKFQPATKDGNPITVMLTVEMNFSLR